MNYLAASEADAGASLCSVRLSDFGLQREPPRPLDDRDVGYESLFDYDTLFYDAFFTADDGQVVCLGPPLLNCQTAILGARFSHAQTGEPITWRYLPPPSPLQPSCRLVLDVPRSGALGDIRMEVGARRAEFAPQPSGQGLFAARRVLLTLAKDQPLEWVCDWAEFNVRIHGADAVLLYDNGSTAHSIADIRNALAGVSGLSRVVVVPWAFPYGPGVGPRNVQDSFFCQPGALDHARRRYCGQAAGVLNTDIDELVASRGGGSVFEALERSGDAAMHFAGIWTETVVTAEPDGGAPQRRLRHSDCLHNWRSEMHDHKSGRLDRLQRTKWVLSPQRCGERVAWQVHGVAALATPESAPALRKPLSGDFFYRHHRQINTGWKTPRAWRNPFSRRKHSYDWDMAAAMQRAFPDRDIEPPGGIIDRLLWRLMRRRKRARKADRDGR